MKKIKKAHMKHKTKLRMKMKWKGTEKLEQKLEWKLNITKTKKENEKEIEIRFERKRKWKLDWKNKKRPYNQIEEILKKRNWNRNEMEVKEMLITRKKLNPKWKW